MPAASQELVDEANDVLKNGTFQEKLDFMKKAPLCPPSNYAHGGAHTFNVRAKSPFGDRDTRAKKLLTKKKLDRVVDRVAFVKFVARDVASGEPGSITFDLKYAEDLPTDGQRADYTPIWFLPWESGFMWKLKIESAATTAQIQLPPATTAPIPNPDVFFTAAINGCSVFARGAATEPRLYHGGAEKNEITAIQSEIGNALWNQLGGNAEGLWRNLFQGLQVRHGQLALRNNPPKANDATVGEVNKNLYVKESLADGSDVLSPLSMGKQLAADQDKPSTILAIQLEQYILNNPNYRDMKLEEVSPWGCAFGLRNGNNWNFYLQTNATVRYYTLHKVKRFLRSTKTKYGGEYAEYETLAASQWPKSKSVNFGLKQFFPGTHGHIRAPWSTFRFT